MGSELQSLIIDRPVKSSPESLKFVPHNYEKRAIRKVVSQSVAGLFMDPGMGKTVTILAAFKLLKKKGFVRRMFLIAPLRVARNTWPQELRKWLDFNSMTMEIAHGKNKEDILLNGTADITVINPEGLPLLVEKIVKKVKHKRTGKERIVTKYELKKEFRRGWGWDMLVIDESTKFKHSNTDRFKRLKKILPKFQRRYILTGTPVPNGLLDLFGQIYILDEGRALGGYITNYKMKWFNQTGYGGYTWIPREDAFDGIYKLIKPYILRLESDDYIKLPPMIERDVYIELPDKVMYTYASLEQDLIAKVEQGLILAKNAAVSSSKCRQVANGGVLLSDEDGRPTKKIAHLHTEKVDAVADLLEELVGKPTLILYEFNHDKERLLKKLGKKTPCIGETNKKDEQIFADWNAGLIPYMLAQISSVAHGLNLQATGRAIIIHSQTWNLEDYIQSIRRIYRQGQKNTTYLYRIIARGTTDEDVISTLSGKSTTQTALLDALKTRTRGKYNGDTESKSSKRKAAPRKKAPATKQRTPVRRKSKAKVDGTSRAVNKPGSSGRRRGW